MHRSGERVRRAVSATGLASAVVIAVVAYAAAVHNPQNVYIDPQGAPTAEFGELLLSYILVSGAVLALIWCLGRVAPKSRSRGEAASGKGD